MSDNEAKWTCDYCTYSNWKSASKCTMCRAPRPLQLIESHRVHPGCSQASQTDQNHCSSNSLESPITESGLWSCPICTFINQAKTPSCAMCCSTRPLSPAATPAVTTTDLPALLEPLTLEDVGAKQSSPPHSRRSSPSLDNDKENAATATKWTCPSCTYCNWPRATKCIMCQSPVPLPAGACRPPSPPEANHALNNYEHERRLRQWRRQVREADWTWLNAVIATVEGQVGPVSLFLQHGGDPLRQLTASDVAILQRNFGSATASSPASSFETGISLVQLALKHQREDVLAVILCEVQGGGPGRKRTPCTAAPDLSLQINRHVGAAIRTAPMKGHAFACPHLTDTVTVVLPLEVEDLPLDVQEVLYDELLDKDAQKELEPEVINWGPGSRLLALWNRTAGDCLLDSALQATWGVCDRQGVLRQALADALQTVGHLFYPRWREQELRLALGLGLGFCPTESQLSEDWAASVARALRPGMALEQLHVFVLAHIFRRPIVVYGTTRVKSHLGEPVGFSPFQGVYLPLLWEPNVCWKAPIALGYTRGHFSALVCVEPDTAPYSPTLGAGGGLASSSDLFLPLVTSDGALLPLHFVTEAECGREEGLLKQWLEVRKVGGVLGAAVSLPPRSRLLLQAQMFEEWLHHYRRLAQLR